MKLIRICLPVFLLAVQALPTNTFRYFFFTPQYVKVFMKDGSTLVGRFFTFTPRRNKKEVTILKLNRTGRSIRPDETDSIIVDLLVGKPFGDQCWMFKIIDGDICAYSTKPDRETTKITHIQKLGGPVVPYRRDVLKKYISDKQRVMHLFKAIFDNTEKRTQTDGAREAILEYNFGLVGKEKKLNALIKKMNRAGDIYGKAKAARSILKLDSTNYVVYEVLGDYEVSVNKDEEKAYFYYTNMIRYCPRKYPKQSLLDKINNLDRDVIY